MKKILYDKVNECEANIIWYMDNEGGVYINCDPYGMSMSGKVTIRPLRKDHPQYEIRWVK